MYRVLKNPFAPSYERVKNLIFEQRFEWIFNPSSTEMDPKYKEEHTDAPFYSHIVIQRPEFQLYPEPQSKYCNLFVDCLEDIINENTDQIPFHVDDHFWTRINVNATHPNTGNQLSLPHVDHRFPHYNMIVYLNDCDGDTIVEGKSIQPEEDKVIVFEGEHYMKLPTSGRRVIIVATLLNYTGNISYA